MFGWDKLFAEFEGEAPTRRWLKALSQEVHEALTLDRHRHLAHWLGTLDKLPSPAEPTTVGLERPAITCTGALSADETEPTKELLREFSPWRKGPFSIDGIFIDTEWRCDLKWQRLEPHLDLQGLSVLDVGCGNGYYGWRMLGCGAERVVGLEPSLLYLVQFAALRKFFGPLPNYVLPVPDRSIPINLQAFDTVFSMGVLYHRKSPIEHLQTLRHALKTDGQLVLETLVIEGGDREVLVPDDRYARMPNVWFIPTVGLLEQLLRRSGFIHIEVLDVTPTTTSEQRTTEWMPFESLEYALNPDHPSQTIEGYPGPLRAILTARR